MKVQHLFFIPIFLLIISSVFAAYPHVEEWEGGTTAGWGANTIVSTVVHAAAGGNPDGHIQTRGTGYDSFDVGALTEIPDFTGDYAADGITGASVDINFMSGPFDAAWIRFRYMDATQNGWLYPLTDVFDNAWNTFSVMFDPTWTDMQARDAGWLTDDDVDPTADPSMSFAATMANVYTAEVRISGEGEMLAGIDNFTLIPEPASMTLFGLGILVLRRRK